MFVNNVVQMFDVENSNRRPVFSLCPMNRSNHYFDTTYTLPSQFKRVSHHYDTWLRSTCLHYWMVHVEMEES